MKKIIPALLLIPLFFLLGAGSPASKTYVVKKVIDGDTLKLSNGDSVRLIGIDTPESMNNSKTRKDSERSGEDIKTITTMGKKAAEYTKQIIHKGDDIRLEFDVRKKDKYGRLLAYVYKLICLNDCAIEAVQGYEYSRLDDGWYIFVNATIIKSGYASPMTIPPNVKYADLFQKLFEEARDNKRGLWK